MGGEKTQKLMERWGDGEEETVIISSLSCESHLVFQPLPGKLEMHSFIYLVSYLAVIIKHPSGITSQSPPPQDCHALPQSPEGVMWSLTSPYPASLHVCPSIRHRLSTLSSHDQQSNVALVQHAPEEITYINWYHF